METRLRAWAWAFTSLAVLAPPRALSAAPVGSPSSYVQDIPWAMEGPAGGCEDYVSQGMWLACAWQGWPHVRASSRPNPGYPARYRARSAAAGILRDAAARWHSHANKSTLPKRALCTPPVTRAGTVACATLIYLYATPPQCSPTKAAGSVGTPLVSGTTTSDLTSAEAGTVYEEVAQEQAAASDAPFMEALLSTSLDHPHIVRPSSAAPACQAAAPKGPYPPGRGVWQARHRCC